MRKTEDPGLMQWMARNRYVTLDLSDGNWTHSFDDLHPNITFAELLVRVCFFKYHFSGGFNLFSMGHFTSA